MYIELAKFRVDEPALLYKYTSVPSPPPALLCIDTKQLGLNLRSNADLCDREPEAYVTSTPDLTKAAPACLPIELFKSTSLNPLATAPVSQFKCPKSIITFLPII